MLERLSTHRIPFPGGVAFLDRGFPLRYDSNKLWVDRAVLDAAGLADEADRILGGAGLRHRGIVVADNAAADPLAVGFATVGYALDTVVAMVQGGEPARRRDPSAAEELSFREARPLIEETIRREPWATSGEVVGMLTDFRAKLEAEAGARFFVARADGVPAARCELYVDGDEAQIEDVTTLEEYRGRGLGSAVVLRAAAAARESGARFVFLDADANDWPRHWYGSLGFREVGRVHTFVRWPERAHPG